MKCKIASTLLTGILGFSFLLTGCNRGVNEKTVELEFFNFKSENVEIMQELIDEYESANPNIEITLNAPNKPTTVLRTRLTKNKIPDIIAYQGDVLYPELIQSGMLTDMTNWKIYQDLPDTYKEMLKDINFSDTETNSAFGYPYALNAYGVLYNRDIFQTYDLEIPRTWTELEQVVEVLEANGIAPFEMTMQTQWTALDPWNMIQSILLPNNFWQERWDKKTTFYDTHREMAEKYKYLTMHANQDYRGTSYSDGLIAFTQGKAAMVLDGNFTVSPIRQLDKDFPVGMFALPASDDEEKNNITAGVDVMLSVMKDTKHPEEARKFVEFMVEKEQAQKYMNDQSSFSPVAGTSQEDLAVENIAPMYENGDIYLSNITYYPAAMMIKPLIQEFGIEGDVETFLQKLDSEFDSKSKLAN